MNHRALILDTSTERGIVAIAQDTEILAEQHLPHGLRNSSTLMPTTANLLAQHNLAPQNLTCIVVTTGPGSYTGIRVGVAAAKGMAYALQIPLVGVSSLNGFPTTPTSAVAIDAKIGGLYLQKHGEDPMLVSLQDAENALLGITEMVTPAAEPLKKRLEAHYPNFELKWIESPPSAQALWEKGLEKLQSRDFTLNGSLELLYLRKTQAEMEAERTTRTFRTSKTVGTLS